MSTHRTTLPVSLPGATEFSDEPELLNEVWAIEALKQQPQWLAPLLEETEALSLGFGRPRLEGKWALAFLAFAVSRHVDVEPWWAKTQEQIWLECDFPKKPSYQTTYSRFTELEAAAESFSKVVALLVQQAAQHTNGLVGRDIHVDSTEAETNSRLIHDCQKNERCNKSAQYLKRATNAEVREERHKQSAEAPVDTLDIGDAERIVEDEDGRVRIKSGGCWYRTLDSTAGVRAYINKRTGKTKKFWHGYYNMKAIDITRERP
jgi:hypothetical protein